MFKYLINKESNLWWKNPSILSKSLDKALEQLRYFQMGSKFIYNNQQFIHTSAYENLVCTTTTDNILIML